MGWSRVDRVGVRYATAGGLRPPIGALELAAACLDAAQAYVERHAAKIVEASQASSLRSRVG